MATGAVERMPRNQRIEAVAVGLRKQSPRKAHRAQHARGECAAQTRVRMLQEPVVEARVVRDEHAVREALGEFCGDRRERRRATHHCIGDAGERLDGWRDGDLGIDQRAPFVDAHHAVLVIDAQHGNLGDAIHRRAGAGGLEIDEGE